MALQVTSLEFYVLENGKKHRTDRFELLQSKAKVPIVRRGQEFSVALKFDRDYVPNYDKVKIIFDLGEF